MNSKEFVYWMRGFVTACPRFHPTPEQWDLLVENLHKVKLEESSIVGNGTTTIAKGIPHTGVDPNVYPSIPKIWYGTGTPPENLVVQSTGTPPDFRMGYPTSAVDKEVDKILKG